VVYAMWKITGLNSRPRRVFFNFFAYSVQFENFVRWVVKVHKYSVFILLRKTKNDTLKVAFVITFMYGLPYFYQYSKLRKCIIG